MQRCPPPWSNPAVNLASWLPCEGVKLCVLRDLAIHLYVSTEVELAVLRVRAVLHQVAWSPTNAGVFLEACLGSGGADGKVRLPASIPRAQYTILGRHSTCKLLHLLELSVHYEQRIACTKRSTCKGDAIHLPKAFSILGRRQTLWLCDLARCGVIAMTAA